MGSMALPYDISGGRDGSDVQRRPGSAGVDGENETREKYLRTTFLRLESSKLLGRVPVDKDEALEAGVSVATSTELFLLEWRRLCLLDSTAESE